MNEAICRRLQSDTCTEWYTLEGKLSEWNIQFDSLTELAPNEQLPGV